MWTVTESFAPGAPSAPRSLRLLIGYGEMESSVTLALEGVTAADCEALLQGTEMVVGGVHINSRGNTILFEADTDTGSAMQVEAPKRLFETSLREPGRRLAGDFGAPPD